MFCQKCSAQLEVYNQICPKCGDFVKRNTNYAEEENKNLFSVKGRISRSTFWWNQLLCLVGSILAIIPVLGIFVVLALFLISTSAMIKRLQDMDKSAWFVMLVLIPILGSLILLIWCGTVKGTEGPNQYGNDPLRKNVFRIKSNLCVNCSFIGNKNGNIWCSKQSIVVHEPMINTCSFFMSK